MSASGRCDTTFAPCIHQLHGICLERMIGYDNLIGHFLRDFGHLLGRNIETCVFPTPSVTDARPRQTWFVRGYCTRQKWSYPMVINHCNGKKNIHIAPFNCTFSPGIFQVREFPSHELTPSSLRPVSDGTRFGQLAVDGFDSFETYLRKKHVFTFTISGWDVLSVCLKKSYSVGLCSNTSNSNIKWDWTSVDCFAADAHPSALLCRLDETPWQRPFIIQYMDEHRSYQQIIQNQDSGCLAFSSYTRISKNSKHRFRWEVDVQVRHHCAHEFCSIWDTKMPKTALMFENKCRQVQVIRAYIYIYIAFVRGFPYVRDPPTYVHTVPIWVWIRLCYVWCFDTRKQLWMLVYDALCLKWYTFEKCAHGQV